MTTIGSRPLTAPLPTAQAASALVDHARDAVAKFTALADADAPATRQLAKAMHARMTAAAQQLPAGTRRDALLLQAGMFGDIAKANPAVKPVYMQGALAQVIRELAIGLAETGGRERQALQGVLGTLGNEARRAVTARQAVKPAPPPAPKAEAPKPVVAPISLPKVDATAAFAPLPAAPAPTLTAPDPAPVPTAKDMGVQTPDPATQFNTLINGCFGGILGIAVAAPVLTIAGPFAAAAAGIGMVAAAINVGPKWF